MLTPKLSVFGLDEAEIYARMVNGELEGRTVTIPAPWRPAGGAATGAPERS